MLPMVCPECSSNDHRVPVTNGRLTDQIVRKRVCKDCGHVWFTVEVIVPKFVIGWAAGLDRKPVLRVPMEITAGRVQMRTEHVEPKDQVAPLLEANRRRSMLAELKHRVNKCDRPAA
jgi:hypothetical protein